MKVLVVGSGGREAAMVWRLGIDSPNAKIYCAPGNAGIAHVAGCVDIKVTDIDALVEFAKLEGIDLVIVDPEMPLIAGLADKLREAGISVCGPSAEAAMAEGSKVWFKEFLSLHGHPTAAFKVSCVKEEAKQYLRRLGSVTEIVIKANGPMAGKGAFLPDTLVEAEKILDDIMVKGGPGDWVVIERRMSGSECSVIVMTDGETVHFLPMTRDYKRLEDGDKGPNTGGMGACTITLGLEMERQLKDITVKVVRDLAKVGRPFKGFLYLGFMLTPEGPMILEANCRSGDPETEVIMMAMGGNFLDLCMGVATGELDKVPRPTKLYDAACVVLASPEYPGSSKRNDDISVLPECGPDDPVQIFHAGTGWRGNDEGGRFITRFTTNKAGRVLVVAACAPSLLNAVALAYDTVCAIDFPGMHYRHDIGQS